MTPEDNLLIACLKQDFSPEQRQEVGRLVNRSRLDWDVILSAAVTQGVAPLLHMNLTQCSADATGVPAGVMEHLQLSEIQAVALHRTRVTRLERLLAFLNNISIETMLIKGTALEILVYDRPWMTTTNDIDLILNIEEEQFSGDDREEFQNLAGGYSLEYDFFEHHDVTMNGILPIDFQRVWTDARTAAYYGQPCQVMSVEDMLITLCINSCRKRYFRLKSLFDINETVRRCVEIDWSLLAEKARVYRCNFMVYTALLATQATLGCRLPDTLRQDLALSPVRSRLIRSQIEKRTSQTLFGPRPSRKILGRGVDPSLMLPYLSYRWDQIVKRIWYVWRTRRRPMGLIDAGRSQPENTTIPENSSFRDS